MSSSSEPAAAPERLQLRRRVSILDLTGPDSSSEDDARRNPRNPQSSPPNKKPAADSRASLPTTTPPKTSSSGPSDEVVAELRDEIEALEDALERVAAEKHALKMRLNELEFVQRFQVGHCKRWLATNFDFDRKDSPDLLAGIFEDYLLQNDSFEPLPHQVIIKNSARARTRRDKLVQQRTNLQQYHPRGLKRDATPAASDLPPLKKAAASAHRVHESAAGDTSNDNTTTTNTNNSSTAANSSIWDVYNVFIPVDEMERLMALEPWRTLAAEWPPVVTSSRAAAVAELLEAQEAFLKEYALAIWERSHWFPIKQQNGRTESEIKRLATLHNRRKRRQTTFKAALEQLARAMQQAVERTVLRQSIFSAEAVEMLLRRPRLWIPREGEDLVAQLEEIDRLEPERLQYV